MAVPDTPPPRPGAPAAPGSAEAAEAAGVTAAPAAPEDPGSPGPTTPSDDPLAGFAALLTDEGQRLLAELRSYEPARELALASRLRRDHPAGLVTSAFAQARLRQRAAAKFAARDAARMYFTPHGLEQATRADVAAHRARGFAARGARRVADLCCGVGGDAIELARAGLAVLAVDRDPLTCAVARANVAALGLTERVEVRCADVTEVDTGGCDAVFVDPARRGGQRRIFDPEAYAPPLSWAIEAARTAGAGGAALKIAPGVPHEALPAEAEAEWVSHQGDVKEAVLWFGPAEPAATGARGTSTRRHGVRATLLPGGHTLSAAEPSTPPAGPVGRYLHEPDGAVIRAHLLAEVADAVGGWLIDPSIAYVSADELVRTPYATPYEITDVLPFHLKRLRALLREREVGSLTVKKRGSPLEPEELRRKVKPRGRQSATVFLTRVAGAPSMLLGHPVPRSTD